MTRMTRIALHYIAAACLAVAATGCAETAPPAPAPALANRTPSPDSSEAVDRILEKYTAAIGGAEAIERVTSYKARGTFRMSILPEPGTFEVWAKDPDKSLTVVTFPRLSVIRKGRDGETRWTQTPFGGATDEGPNEFTGLERDADIYRAGRIKAMYESMRLEGMGLGRARRTYRRGEAGAGAVGEDAIRQGDGAAAAVGHGAQISEARQRVRQGAPRGLP